MLHMQLGRAQALTISREDITPELAQKLVRSQFPQWAELPVRPVRQSGWDNRTFRLGDDLLIRMPSGEGYAPQVPKEQEWLPKLAPQLPLEIPQPVAMGAPGEGYPWHWSIYRWIAGEPATTGKVASMAQLALDLAGFLRALQAADTTGGPLAGPHSWYRGGHLEVYGHETRRAVAALGNLVEGQLVTEIWEAAVATRWPHEPVWVHGDVTAQNLIVRHGVLHAVIDFGCSAVGDPACDLAVAWTFFSGDSREAFVSAMGLDDGTWLRGMGWTLWKALITIEGSLSPRHPGATESMRVIREVVRDYLDWRS